MAEERTFWDAYLATGGLHWPEEYADRTRPDRLVDEHVAALVRLAPHDPVRRILDVGSGPLSAVAGTVPGRTVELVAVDPLARWYGVLYRRHDVSPLVRPVEGRAESLRTSVPADHFDVVVARNALDHAVDPSRAVREMLAVARPGGWVHLEHAEREGERRRYRGLHHWDFLEVDGHLLVGHRGIRKDLTVELEDVAEVSVDTDAQGWIRARMHRRG